MECQSLFSGKSKKKSKYFLLKVLYSMLSIKGNCFLLHLQLISIFEPVHNKTYNKICAISEDSPDTSMQSDKSLC